MDGGPVRNRKSGAANLRPTAGKRPFTEFTGEAAGGDRTSLLPGVVSGRYFHDYGRAARHSQK